MSDSSEKPFDATPRRIAKAKGEGNVARSSEVGANLAFAAGGVALAAIVPAFAAVACGVLRAAAAGGGDARAVVWVLVTVLVPIAAAAAAGCLATLMQSGGFFPVSVAPKAERLNPTEGLRRIFSRETLAHSLRASVAFACACGAIAPIVSWSAVSLVRATGLVVAAATAWTASRQVAAAAVAVGLCFSVAEFAAARNVWLRKLRMSFEDRKREVKEEEGDAVARGRRRSLHRALLRGGIGRIKSAAFVITNPTHVAVALEYRPPEVAVPRILLRAAEHDAWRVRRVAAGYRIPIVENAPLARALYRDVRVGESIPHLHYVAVAEVVCALIRANALVS